MAWCGFGDWMHELRRHTETGPETTKSVESWRDEPRGRAGTLGRDWA
jgi:hypothetical protein